MIKMNHMKPILARALLFFSIFAAQTASAGWGAIAVNANDATGVSYGWPDYNSAANEAMDYCESMGAPGCRLVAWEQNECVYWEQSYTCN
jgi:hypothetical protein